MNLRPTQNATYAQVRRGLFLNLARLVRSQEQVSTGRRINRPSDDPTGAARALAYSGHIAGAERFDSAAQSGRTRLDLGAGRLQDGSDVLVEARELLLQGMNGTLNAGDREVLADQVRILRDRLLEAANARGTDGFLFDGTAGGDTPPFSSVGVHGRQRVVYAGNGEQPELLVGEGLRVSTGLPGSDVFALVQRSATQYGGFTGAAPGQSGDAGTGFAHLQLRHDATSGTLGSGLAFAAGGAFDTILGAHTLVVDGVAGTVQLDAGPVLAIPQPGAPGLADFTVVNEHGAELHLDFSGFGGGSFTSGVDGAGSISLDGAAWSALDFLDPDLQVDDPATGTVLHVDTRGIHRAGSELVVFGGAVNAFDALQGIADDLENVDGLPTGALLDRFSLWLAELDRNHDNVVGAMGVLGGRSARLSSVVERVADEHTELTARRSALVDTDYSQAALELARAEQTLQLAQATGSRLISTTLLDFLR